MDVHYGTHSHSKMPVCAFLKPLHNVRFIPCYPNSLARSTIRVRRARTPGVARAPARHLPLCSAQEQGTKEHEPETSALDRAELARKARHDAEKLELMAERARLESERAQLFADRKRFELDKAKAKNKKNDVGAVSAEAEAATETAESKASLAVDVKELPSGDKRMSIKPPFTQQAISDLVGVDFPRVDEKDIAAIKEHVCGLKTFFCTEVDRSPFSERVVFRGNLRLDADIALDKLEELAKEQGLNERVRLFLLLDPKDDSSESKKPVLVALPAAAVPNQTNFLSTSFALIAAAVTAGTTFAYSVGIFGFTPAFIDEVARGNLDEFYYTIPISVGMAAIISAHDIAHRVMGELRDVKLGLPYCIPSLQVGAFGTVTPLESYPRTRKDLFDVAVAGPLVGMALSIGALLSGLVMTANGAGADWFPQIPSSLFHASVLVGTLADLILPSGIREQATLAVHPLTVVGYTGLLVNALNLLPIGRLDGGRIVQALYGRALAGRISSITLILQGLASVFGNSPLLLFWGLICIFLQRESDYPCRNEIVEPDDGRAALGLVMLFLMLSVLTPLPGSFNDILGSL